MKKFRSLSLVLALPIMVSAMVYTIPQSPSYYMSDVVETIESTEVSDVTDVPWVNETLASLTLEEKIAQFFMIAAYSGKKEDHFKHIDSLVAKYKIGGLIFFQGDRGNLTPAIDRFQNQASVPLLVGMDAEWGVSMRLSGEERFPYAYTVGAAHDEVLAERIAEMMGQECRELGIHINFAPVADVNSNPRNPVIGFRSYGENPRRVSQMVSATVRGMEGQSVLTSIKHFPGHGDTDKDSHKELPTVNHSKLQLEAIDFYPFKEGIRAGASTVMVGHLNVPALDDSGMPSSLSKKTIQGVLQGEMGFNGLVISDALGMKAVADRYGKTEVVVRAFEAGCDILLFPKSVVDAIEAIKAKVEAGEISQEEIDRRCKKVLMAKYKSIIKPNALRSYTQGEQLLARKQLFEEAITVIRNENDVFPIKRFDAKIAVVSLGKDVEPLKESMDLVAGVDHFNYATGSQALAALNGKVGSYDLIITTLHPGSVRPKDDFKLPKEWRQWVKQTTRAKKSAVVVLGNPLAFQNLSDVEGVDALVVGYEGNPLMLDRMGQFLVGSIGAQGELPMSINPTYKAGHGIKVKAAGRLKESQPEALGIDPKYMDKIDSIAELGITKGAYPGCQIVIAIDGQVIHRKSYGHHTYRNKIAVRDSDLYDIASITKIASSTLAVMKLNSDTDFNLEQTLGDCLPELVTGSSYANIKLRDMMSHQAGLTPWIPFYTETLNEGKLSDAYYRTIATDSFSVQVAEQLFIDSDYQDEIYKTILAKKLGPKRYKYSDVGYYFLKKIIEKEYHESLDAFVTETFYEPMGLVHMRYNPLRYYSKNEITPTEDDKIFRKQQIHGYVHDQGAALMGGVGGHAGLFSNASDLASLMQMYLNGGTYGDVRFIKEQVLEEYTDCQYCSTNRRGAGFDKPVRNRQGGPSSNLASLKSYGHSGFTGTLAWADPEFGVNYVFLSNRVYPDAENWKLVKMGIRTEIQDLIYEALAAAKKKKV